MVALTTGPIGGVIGALVGYALSRWSGSEGSA
jgi:hypothetical protein